MDTWFHNPQNPVLKPFKDLGDSIYLAKSQAGYCVDTTLRLNSIDFYGSSISPLSASKGIKRKWTLIDGPADQQCPLPLCLGLGHSLSSSDNKGSSTTACTTLSSAKETDDESSMDLELDFSLHLSNEKTPSPKQSTSSNLKVGPMVDLELSLSAWPAESNITSSHPTSDLPQNVVKGSISSIMKMASSFFPLRNSKNSEAGYFLNPITPAQVNPDRSSSMITQSKISVTCISRLTQQRNSSAKTCQFEGCGRGARGASGLCIAHGGGRRCQRPGCPKGAEGRTAFCKAHGGGRRCEFLGCTKSAEGRTDYCIAHGGGRRCTHQGCTCAARGKSGLCVRHGGGKRCQKENCTKSAEGLSGLCISHGGGRRCQYQECTKGAQGNTMFCKAHGGGKRCTFEGCTKGAEGSTLFCKGHGGGKRCAFEGGGVCPKSVHGGTLYCVAHGGGKRCAVAECTKSARGRTDFCVRHGGGKRCKFEGCNKSAQGSTDFCKAHGGGKTCSWGRAGSGFGEGEGPCSSFAWARNGLCASHGASVQDKRVYGGATMGVMVHDSDPRKSEKIKEVIGSKDVIVDIMNMGGGFVILEECNGSAVEQFGLEESSGPDERDPSSDSEARVHGGCLGALLSGKQIVYGAPETRELSLMPKQWM